MSEQQRFVYTDRDYLSLRDQITSYLKAKIPGWVPGGTSNDQLGEPNDFATVFVEAMAMVGDMMSYYVDVAAQESSILTSNRPGNVLSWAELFGYVPAMARSAETLVQLSTTNPQGVLVPNRLAVTNPTGPNYSFEIQFPPDPDGTTPLTKTVMPGSPLLVKAWEGQTHFSYGDTGYELGSSDGSPGQSFAIPHTSIDSREFWVDVLNYDDEVSEDTGRWRFTYHLLDCGPDDQAFTARLRSDGRFYIVFGDGRAGKIPPSGYTLHVRYRSTVGATASGEAAVPAGALTMVNGSWDQTVFATLADLDVTNTVASYGGIDTDTLSTVRRNTINITRSQRRAVTARDYEDIAMAEGDVLTAWCSTEVWSRPTLWILPRSTHVLNDTTEAARLVARVQQAVSQSAMLGTSVDVRLGKPTALRLELRAYTWPTLRHSTVKSAVVSAITKDFVYDNLRFGKELSEDDILLAISKNVPFRVVRYAVPNLTPVFPDQPMTSNANLPIGAREESRRFAPFPGELLYLDTDNMKITVVGGIEDQPEG